MSRQRPGGPAGRGPSAAGARAREAARLAAEQAARRRRDRRLLILAVVVLVVVVVGGGVGLQAYRTRRAPDAVTPVGAASDAPQQVRDGRPIRLGSAGAPVEVTLYEDFRCPHCADFEEELGPTLTAAQNAGQVSVELYPMSFVDLPSSAFAANAMACATEAGFGQRYYLGLFANHDLQWTDAQLVDLAGKVGGHADSSFTTCVNSRARAAWVESINTAAGKNDVHETPTMLLDGAPLPIEGLTPARLQGDIDAAVRAAAR